MRHVLKDAPGSAAADPCGYSCRISKSSDTTTGVVTGSPNGDITAFIQYSRQFTMPITQIASQMNMLQSGMASAERVSEFLDSPEEAPEPASAGPAAARPSRVAGRVTLEHVSFRYDPDKPRGRLGGQVSALG
jgi:ABC-type multidrug transport system fused ATPase/permease subunit